jgi:hypothetical protein
MIAGSLALRSSLDDDGDDDGGTRTVGTVVCATELAGVCEALAEDGADVQVEPAGATADMLINADQPEVDAWIVTAPWIAIVEERRGLATLEPLFGEVTTVARSPLVIVGYKEALGTCAQWPCVGDAVRAGELDIAHGSADGAVSLLVLGQALAVRAANPDPSRDVFDDPAIEQWFFGMEDRVERSAFDDLDPVTKMLTARGTYDAVATSEAAARLALGDVARPEVALIYPAPVASADLVVAPLRDHRTDVERVRRAVEQTCWRGSSCAARQPALADGDGLPSPGFLEALRQRWKETLGR